MSRPEIGTEETVVERKRRRRREIAVIGVEVILGSGDLCQVKTEIKTDPEVENQVFSTGSRMLLVSKINFICLPC